MNTNMFKLIIAWDKLKDKLRWWWFAWGPFAFKYASNCGPKVDTYGIGWRRWVLYYHRKGAYGGTMHGFRWCNYFGTGEGG